MLAQPFGDPAPAQGAAGLPRRLPSLLQRRVGILDEEVLNETVGARVKGKRLLREGRGAGCAQR